MARDFDPPTGRYIQADPLGIVLPGFPTRRLNQPYAYADNNPLSNVDPLGLCPCAGGVWDQEFGDSQASVAAGIYLSVAKVNYTCRSNPSLKCSGRQSCIGGGPIIGGGLSFNIAGTVRGTNDSNNLGGWSGSSATTSFGIFGSQFPIGAPGGSFGGGPGFGVGAAYINCYTDNLKCNCPCEK